LPPASSSPYLFRHEWPDAHYPIASLVAIASFFILLFVEHLMARADVANGGAKSCTMPVIMTLMIVFPSFFLGAALGISGLVAEIFIFVAIIAHKSSAGFALALKMVRSDLSRTQVIALYMLFAFSTPVGIVVGRDLHEYLSGSTMHIVKAFILSMAAGTFLFMSTLHEFKDTPLIKDCASRKGFAWAVFGFAITAVVRLLIGEAHRF
jgi:zinc transporter 1/2/3